MKKRLLLLGGGVEQLNALRVARELGAYVIVFDGHKSAACTHEADEFYQVDIKDHQQLLAKAKALNIDSVFVHAAELAIECALVAETFGLPGISTEAAKLGTDKILRSQCLKKAGVRVPSFHPLNADSEWKNWLEAAVCIQFPLIVKPTNMAGAAGVEYIADEETLRQYYASRRALKSRDFIMEEYVSGIELSTESVVVGGVVTVTNIALRHYDTTDYLWPFQIEDGHSMPWADEECYKDTINEMVAKCAAAFGLETGVLKGDLVLLPNKKIIVLEMAVRTSGGRFCDTVVPLSTGVNILYPLIQFALGGCIEQTFLEQVRSVGVSQRFVLIPAGVKLVEQKKIQHILLQDRIAGWWFREDLADLRVVPDIKSHRDRLGYVICTGASREDADKKAKEVVKELSVAMSGVRE